MQARQLVGCKTFLALGRKYVVRLGVIGEFLIGPFDFRFEFACGGIKPLRSAGEPFGFVLEGLVDEMLRNAVGNCGGERGIGVGVRDFQRSGVFDLFGYQSSRNHRYVRTESFVFLARKYLVVIQSRSDASDLSGGIGLRLLERRAVKDSLQGFQEGSLRRLVEFGILIELQVGDHVFEQRLAGQAKQIGVDTELRVIQIIVGLDDHAVGR